MSSREDRLDLLAEAACYDVCLASCSGNTAGGVGRMRDPAAPAQRWIYPAYVPGRGRVGILKILQTNVCTNNCSYCALACSRDGVHRTGFSPDELSSIFMGFYKQRLCHGIFLSSGVAATADRSMTRMIDTATILRKKYRFRDYIHLKILPGCSHHLIDEAAKVANRISVNLEAPSPECLSAIAPQKDFYRDVVMRMRWAAEAVQGDTLAASQITQFVVGAARESDMDILKAVDRVYREYHVFRSYFSAYQPPGERDPVPETAETGPLLREHRLYQTDFLLRGYGFRLHDIVFDGSNRLPMEVDPKTAYAMMHPELFPVDVNTATEHELLRVPGIGPIAARRILHTRRRSPFLGVSGLKSTGAWVNRAAPYVLFNGRRDLANAESSQRWLFECDPPEGWTTGIASRRSTPGEHYAFPGQTGKRLHYPAGKSTDNLICR